MKEGALGNVESAHGAHKLNDKSRRTCPCDGEGPRNLPRLFSVGADLSTGKARARARA